MCIRLVCACVINEEKKRRGDIYVDDEWRMMPLVRVRTRLSTPPPSPLLVSPVGRCTLVLE